MQVLTSRLPPGLDKAKGFANSQDSMQSSQDLTIPTKIEHALVEYLSRKPETTENLPKIGLYLRSRSLTPLDGLKQFIISKPERFEFIEGLNGNHKVKLIGGPLLTKKNIPPAPGLVSSNNTNNTFDYLPGSSNDVPVGIDESRLEHQLVTYIHDNFTDNEPCNMPLLGEYCIKTLGFSMKGYLHRFVGARTHLFELGDDGRQHIFIKQGAMDLVNKKKHTNSSNNNNGNGGSNNNSNGNGEKKSDDLIIRESSSPTATSSSLSSSPSTPSTHTTNNNSNNTTSPPIPTKHNTNNNNSNNNSNNNNTNNQRPNQRPPEYSKWDRVTQEVFNYVAAHGGAVPFKNVEVYMREHWAHLLASAGFPPQLWKCALFTYKRRNIFRKDGNLLALLTMYQSGDGLIQEYHHGGDGSGDNNSKKYGSMYNSTTTTTTTTKLTNNNNNGYSNTNTNTNTRDDDKDSRHHRNTTTTTTLDNNNSNNNRRDHTTSSILADHKSSSLRNKTLHKQLPSTTIDNNHNNAMTTTTKNNTNTNNTTTTASFSQALDEICTRLEDVQRRTSNDVADIHRENLGLRAACVTLGRELLTLKEHVAEMKSQLEAAGLVQFVRSPPPPSMLFQADDDPFMMSSSLSHSIPSDSRSGGGGGTVLDDVVGFLPDMFPGSTTTTTTNTTTSSSHHHHHHHHTRAPPSPITTSITKGTLAHTEHVLLIGGYNDGNGWLDTIDSFSPHQGTFSRFKSMPSPRSFCAAVSTTDGLFVIGGGDGNCYYDSVIMMPSDGSAWNVLAPLSDTRGSMAAAFVKNHLYVFGGGRPGEQCLNFVEYYDIGTDRWLPGPELSTPRFALGGAVLDSYNSIYAVGGYDGESYLATVERLDPREGRWTPITPMSSERGGHACAAHESMIYSIGGYSEQAICECEVYDARANAWMPIAALSDCRSYGDAVALSNGEVLAVGGLRGDMQTPSPLLEVYSPVSGAWKELEVPLYWSTQSRSFLAACLSMT